MADSQPTSKLSSETFWQSALRPKYSSVAHSGHFDAIVIGGGITGLTAAYLLKRAGKKVAVLERDRIGFVDTGLTTAHLTQVTDIRLSALSKYFGRDTAQAVWQAGVRAIGTIEEIARQLDLDCDFHRCDGYLHQSLVEGKDQTESLQQDAHLAKELGFDAQFLPSIPYFDRPGVKFGRQAKFHPLKYIAGLAAAVEGDGSFVFEQSEVTEIKDAPQAVAVGDHELTADYLVIATHVPLQGKTSTLSAMLFQSKLFAYSSYVIGAKVPKDRLPIASFWDTTEPYYYLRVEPGSTYDYAIFGGRDHKTGQADADEQFLELRKVLQTIIPKAKPDRQWSGQVIETNDGLPYIGESATRQFVATGFSGNGMTFGTVAGIMATDAMLGHGNPWRDIFRIDRNKLFGGTWDYVSENIDFPYYFAKDHLTPSEGTSTNEVASGEGKILSLAGQRVACSRDQNGKLSAVSAVCTHMGCLVHWNNAETTWDCPCHGSRFKPTGEVLAGPAESPLRPVETEESSKTSSSKSAPRGSAAKKTPPKQNKLSTPKKAKRKAPRP